MRRPLTVILRSSLLFLRIMAVVTIAAVTLDTLRPAIVQAGELRRWEGPTRGRAASPAGVPLGSAALSATLERIAVLAEGLSAATEAGAGAAKLDELASSRRELEELDAAVMADFEELREELHRRGLPEEIHRRHARAVADYRSQVEEVLASLDALAEARESERPSRAEAVLARVRPSPAEEGPLAPVTGRRSEPYRLPFRPPEIRQRAPRETSEELAAVVAAVAGTRPAATERAFPGPPDLAPTVDAQITDEIQDLATSLGNNPVQIFNWVHDNIRFIPTYGSIQGSSLTLSSRQGNAFDTASLLIALLRSAEVPARYVYGTVEVPIDQVMNWVGGVGEPRSALQLLGQGGIPNVGLTQGGQFRAVRLEHVWVEAWVDFTPSRGAVHREGDTWVPMDASFKQYRFADRLDLTVAVPLDGEALADDLLASASVNETEGWIRGVDGSLIGTAQADYGAEVTDYLAANRPDFETQELYDRRGVEVVDRPTLSGASPYRLVARTGSFSELPASLRHRFRYRLYADELDRIFESPTLSLDASVPELAGKKITLSFAPASQADADLIASFIPEPSPDGTPPDPGQFPSSLPGYLIHLRAELRIDGAVHATGGIFTMGSELFSDIGFREPDLGWELVSNTLTAGDFLAIGVDTGGGDVSGLLDLGDRVDSTYQMLQAGLFDSLTREEVLGDLFDGTIRSYFLSTHAVAESMAQNAEVVQYRGPSHGTFGAFLETQYFFGIPRNVSLGGLTMDVDRVLTLSADRDGGAQRRVLFNQIAGLAFSVLENEVPEELWSDPAEPPIEGVSAVAALAKAQDLGLRIFTVHADNVDSVLPQLQVSQDVKSDIQAAVAAGNRALVPESNVSLGGWTGAGYVLYDPDTGAGAYRITTGVDGGFIVLVAFLLAVLLPALVLLAGGGVGAILFAGVGAFLNIRGLSKRIDQILNSNLLPAQKEGAIQLAAFFSIAASLLGVLGVRAKSGSDVDLVGLVFAQVLKLMVSLFNLIHYLLIRLFDSVNDPNQSILGAGERTARASRAGAGMGGPGLRTADSVP